MYWTWLDSMAPRSCSVFPWLYAEAGGSLPQFLELIALALDSSSHIAWWPCNVFTCADSMTWYCGFGAISAGSMTCGCKSLIIPMESMMQNNFTGVTFLLSVTGLSLEAILFDSVAECLRLLTGFGLIRFTVSAWFGGCGGNPTQSITCACHSGIIPIKPITWSNATGVTFLLSMAERGTWTVSSTSVTCALCGCILFFWKT